MQRSFLARLLVILIATSASASASAHGLTQAMVFVFTTASIERCSDEHPDLRTQLAQAQKRWNEKNPVLTMSPQDRVEVEKAKAAWRKSVLESSGQSTEPECRLLMKQLQSEDGSIDLSKEPEFVALLLGLAKACEEVIPGYQAMLASKPRETKWEQSVALSRTYEGSSEFTKMVESAYETKRHRMRQSLISECKGWVPWQINAPSE